MRLLFMMKKIPKEFLMHPRNIVHHIEAEVGEPDKAFEDADQVFEGEYRTPKQQHAQMEPHVCITYFDEDNRLVVRTSTQVPFHVRRIIAPLIGLPIKQIRVIKPQDWRRFWRETGNSCLKIYAAI